MGSPSHAISCSLGGLVLLRRTTNGRFSRSKITWPADSAGKCPFLWHTIVTTLDIRPAHYRGLMVCRHIASLPLSLVRRSTFGIMVSATSRCWMLPTTRYLLLVSVMRDLSVIDRPGTSPDSSHDVTSILSSCRAQYLPKLNSYLVLTVELTPRFLFTHRRSDCSRTGASHHLTYCHTAYIPQDT
ncbi:hypothetical protein F5B18DRAFT_35420 [Nemania serpens]|nr:hypothetical protein F5B18DRAFT_35420 [Nemania serpens]